MAAGNDSFYYNNFGEGVTIGTPLGTSPDQIGDFVVGQDKIILTQSSFNLRQLTTGSNRLASSAFLVVDNGSYNGLGNSQDPGAPVLVYEAQLNVDNNTGRLLYDPDGSGSQTAITLANFNGKPGLTGSDIILI